MPTPWPYDNITPPIDDPHTPAPTASSFIGIAVAVSGNILISLALNCQKLAHRRLEAQREQQREKGKESQFRRQRAACPGEAEDQNSEQVDRAHDEGPARMEGSSAGEHCNVTLPSTMDRAQTVLLETAPLLVARDRTSREYGLGGHHVTENSKRPGLASRLFPLRFKGKGAPRTKSVGDIEAGNDGQGAADAIQTVIPVDIMTTDRDANGNANGVNRGYDSDDAKEDMEDSMGNESDYLKSKLWWLGFLLMNIGELGNFISYAFAPASVVAPLGTFALIANCLFAPLMVGERFRKRDLFGILLAILGAITVVLASNQSDTRLDPAGLVRAITQRAFIALAVVYIVGACILVGLSEGRLGREWVFVDVGACALFGGFTVLSTKGVSSLLTMEWWDMFTEWITYPVLAVLIGTGVGQIKYLNRALMKFDSKVVIPTQFVLFNLSAIVGSAVLYGDFRKATLHQMVTFLYGCAATFAGVFIITWTPPSNEDNGSANEEDGARPGPTSGDTEISRENGAGRAKLVLPAAGARVILRTKASSMSLLGLSPAQRVLLVHSPPRESMVRQRGASVDAEREPSSGRLT